MKTGFKILISVIIISLFGLLMIYSSSSIWAEYKFDDESGDVSIAAAAVNQLKDDLSKGYDHIVLVRAKTVLRAKQLYEEIYLNFYNNNF